MAHRASLSTSRASLDASFADASMASLAAPSDAGSESFSEVSGSILGPNKNAVAYLVYHNRGDPRVAGYKQPTTRDIPQVKLPRVEAVDALEVDPYLSELKTFERHASPASDSGPAPPPLDAVPSVFFNSDFHLDNPRVFDAVVGEDSSVLQEKLSWYVDVVEAHLEKEIAAASSQFFSATASFQAIEGQAAGLSRQIAAFKAVVGGIQSGVVAHFEETAKLQTKLRDLDALQAALSQLSEFVQAVDSLASQDPAAILDRAAAARKIATQGIDLRKVTVTHQYFDKLSAAESQARSDAASHLVNALLADVRADTSRTVDVDSALTLAERAGVTQQALSDYSHVVDLEVRALVRKQLPGATDDESQGLARSLHTLSADDAEKMCQRLFESLSFTFEKLQRQPIPLSTIQNAVKGADSRLARVLRVRKDPATILSVTQFERFFVDVSRFCDKCESITKIRPVELSEFLVAQTKLYIHTLHSSSDEKLAAAMDADDWRAAEILPQIQAAVDTISSAGSMDPSHWEFVSPDTKPTGTLRILVDGQAYIASKSTQTLVAAVAKYLQLICVLPAVHVSDTAAALLELLRLFNHKAHHLILGFGAKATAGLKHISVKNLMLTSESLRLVYNLMSSLKRCTERHIPTSNMTVLDSFDSVQQNYFDHRSEIESKLVKLMSDKVSTYARQIASTDWSIRQPEANRYIQGLMNDTTKVARVAQEMLPQPLAQAIVAAIFSAYKPALLEAYGEVTVRNADEKENILRDLRFFKAKEIALNGQSRSGDVIYESVKMFVGPDVPDREPDLATESHPATSVRTSPRASVESGLAVDARQAFATAVAQGNAQAEVADSALNSAKHSVLNGKAKLASSNSEAQDALASVVQEGEKTSSKLNGTKVNPANGAENPADAEAQQAGDIKPSTKVVTQDHIAGAEPKQQVGAAETSQAEEAEAKRQAEEKAEAKKQAEAAEAKKQLEEAEAKKQAEEVEAKRQAEEAKQAEEVEARRQAEKAEAKRRAEEAEAKKQAEEAEAKKQAEEAEAKRQAEEAKRQAEEAEASRQAEEAEAKRRAEEAEAKKQAEEAEAKKQAEEAEAKRQAEEAKRQAEEIEARRQAEEAEAKRRAEEAEAKKQAEEAEAKRQAEEAEAKKQAEEAEAKRQAEEAKRQAEEAEASRQAEEAEAKRRAEEAEAKKQAEEAEAKRHAEEAESKRQAAEAEAKKQAEEAEATRQAEEAESKRQAAEAEAKKQAEEAEATRQAAEAEAKRKAEEAETEKQAEESKTQAEEAESKKQAEGAATEKEIEERAVGITPNDASGSNADSSDATRDNKLSQGEKSSAEQAKDSVDDSQQDLNEHTSSSGKDSMTNVSPTDENPQAAAVPEAPKTANSGDKKSASSANKNKKKKNNKKKKHK